MSKGIDSSSNIAHQKWTIQNRCNIAYSIGFTCLAVAATIIAGTCAREHAWTYELTGSCTGVGLLAAAYFGFRKSPFQELEKKKESIQTSHNFDDEIPEYIDPNKDKLGKSNYLVAPRDKTNQNKD